jgi:protoheme IX farnesyltransferase
MSTVIEQSPPVPQMSNRSSVLRDYVLLTKPSITRMCLIMTAGGLWLAPHAIDQLSAVCAMLGTAITVGAANALNMWWERDTDGLMARTADRPLPTGRLSPEQVLRFGLILSVIGCAILAAGTNLLTAALGLFAILSYVLVYTPLKRVTASSVFVGAIPGAMPPLMGWTATSNNLDTPGLILFAILVIWQIPHFLAISVFRKEEYEKAGIVVAPSAWGMPSTKFQTVLWSVVLVPTGMLLTPAGVTGSFYALTTLVTGLAFLGFAVVGLWTKDLNTWARRLFYASLAYLPILIFALVIDQNL